MNTSKNRNYSYLFSITLHSLVIIVLSFIRFSFVPEPEEYVTIGFGTLGTQSSSGSMREEVIQKDEEKSEIKKEEQQNEKVELPKTENTDDNNIVTSEKKDKEDQPKSQPVQEEFTGKDNEGDNTGNYGFEIDFGGKGKRRIYSSPLPTYPDGVSKEIDIKLRFSILPDGTVGTIIPLIKADTRLEMAAIYSLRQWRFEPLPEGVKHIDQKAVIIFPYRLQ